MKNVIVMIALFFVMANSSMAELFIMPEDGTLYIEASGGSAGAVSEIGIGTSIATHHLLISGLPSSPSPTSEVYVGDFAAGEAVVFSMKTLWSGNTYWAFSNNSVADASRYAFMDLNNSLGWGGKVIQQMEQYQWKMHLDDAASYLFDDDDDDVLVSLRVDPVPEPCTLLLLGMGGLAFRFRRHK